MMTADSSDSMFDVPRLLDRSSVRPPAAWMWPAAAIMLAAAVLGGIVPSTGAIIEPQLLVSAAMMGLFAVLGLGAMRAARALAAEHDAVRQANELVRLRRWPEAAAALERLLSRPMHTHHGRLHALMCLGAVLTRYHRYADAAAVYDYLLEQPLDAASQHAMRVGRAMVLLYDDRLYDADRAISELRRGEMAAESAPLALVEIYRHVKTGHPDDALAVFEAKKHLLAAQLGVRTGDVLALVARAHDMLGNTDRARQAYADATVLVPPEELFRRYPETAALAGRYQAAARPAEAA